MRVEQEKEEMQNSILYQTLTNSDKKFLSQRQKTLKNNEILIDADEFSFQKIKVFLIKSSFSKYKKTNRKWGI